MFSISTMRTEQEIRDMLDTIERDDRLALPPAATDENAPLALIQADLEAKRIALRWVLGLPGKVSRAASK